MLCRLSVVTALSYMPWYSFSGTLTSIYSGGGSCQFQIIRSTLLSLSRKRFHKGYKEFTELLGRLKIQLQFRFPRITCRIEVLQNQRVGDLLLLHGQETAKLKAPSWQQHFPRPCCLGNKKLPDEEVSIMAASLTDASLVVICIFLHVADHFIPTVCFNTRSQSVIQINFTSF